MDKHKKTCKCSACKAKRGEYKGKDNPFFGKHHTEEAKRKMSKGHKGQKKKPFTKLHIKNLSKSKLGKKNAMYGLKGKLSPSYGSKRSNKCRKKMSLLRGGTGIPYENRNYSDLFYNIINKIRQRDNYLCQLCDKTEEKNGRKLDVHHIDYNKENCKEENLISLCQVCHPKTNFNRDYWYAYFTYVIEAL